MKIYLRNGFVQLDSPVIMGILNVTPDSFSDGGDFFDNDQAMRRAEQMVREGVQIIDVGGESTRPGAEKISTDEEIDRVLPVVERIKEQFDVLVSIDTYKSRVARTAVNEAGADIINDISALDFSDDMADTVAHLDVPVVLMHIKGSPENMQKDPFYMDLIPEMIQYFHNRIDFAQSHGVKRDKIILDPGIGFGKRLRDNIEIIRRLREFKVFDLPLLMGLSRKSFLGLLGGEEDPRDRETETVTAGVVAIMNGADIIRVHNVRNALKSVRVLKELMIPGEVG